MPQTGPTTSAIGNVNMFDVDSQEVGDTFTIFEAPCGDTSPEAVLFVTDANGLFGLTVDTIRMMQIPELIPSLLVIGIGYRSAATIADTIRPRERDFTPTSSPRFPESGGADRFLRFIRHELRPLLQRNGQLNLNRSIYFGHSLGGLLGAHDLMADERTFDSYILSSPSLWWNHHEALKREHERSMRHPDLSASVFFGIGALETDEGRRIEAVHLPNGHPSKPGRTHLDMVNDMTLFVEALNSREYPGLRLGSVIVPDEFHATVPAAVLTRGLRYHFARTPQPTKTQM